MYTQGLDVSHWNTVKWLDWKNLGYVFAWIKCTEATGFIDPKWQEHYNESAAQDFYRGPYHYFRVQYNGIEQARHFYNAVSGQNWQLPAMVDVERTNNLGYSPEIFAARLRSCLYETEVLFGRRPIIYTSRYSWNSLLGSVAWATAYDLWTAHYTTAPIPLIPNDWSAKGWKIWQYTSTPLDQNRFNGNITDFKEWAGIEISPPSDLDARIKAIEEWQAKITEWAENLNYGE